jgi:hypothetical protein
VQLVIEKQVGIELFTSVDGWLATLKTLIKSNVVTINFDSVLTNGVATWTSI